jgi:hypothetical protein
LRREGLHGGQTFHALAVSEKRFVAYYVGYGGISWASSTPGQSRDVMNHGRNLSNLACSKQENRTCLKKYIAAHPRPPMVRALKVIAPTSLALATPSPDNRRGTC